MKLKLVYSPRNMVVRLINVDAKASDKSSNRVLDAWSQKNGTNLRITYWKNDMISSLNPYTYNRVNVHYENHNNNTITTSYYCIDSIILLDEMTLENFDNSGIQ